MTGRPVPSDGLSAGQQERGGASHTGAEWLVRGAVDSGIEVCFANPGTSEMHFVAALDAVPGIRPVLGLHETVCSGAADGYGRMALKPAATLLHLGPGLANALANLHNARRACTPVLNLVGDMATWHAGADPLLSTDIAAVARTVSRTVHEAAPSDHPYSVAARAVDATRRADAAGGSRVSTLIVPHDLAWQRVVGPAPALPLQRPPGFPEAAARFTRECAAALKTCPRGRAAIYVGGRAALADGGALELAGRVAAATGAALLCENAFARLDRGAGRPDLRRLPYFPEDALRALAPHSLLVLLDARRPVANFGYEGGPSALIALPDEAVYEFDAGGVDLLDALRLLSSEVGGDAVRPLVDCRGAFCPAARPALPTGKLSAAALCTVVAALQPEGAIIVDESLTSGNAYWDASKGCPPFSHLALTGGAIGCGPPLSTGAALACPGRPVINLQADGSGLYSAQALWTQAREALQVVTLVCANRAYAILKVELAKQRIAPGGGRAARALTDIGNPSINWVALAQGFGVPAVSVATCEDLAAQLHAALARSGPSLIEAVL